MIEIDLKSVRRPFDAIDTFQYMQRICRPRYLLPTVSRISH